MSELVRDSGSAELFIGLLGPPCVRLGSLTHDISGGRQQRLLAALALRPGEVVSIARLGEAVWPEGDVPDDPRKTLHSYVYRLRQVLGSNNRVESVHGGYRLTTDCLTVDWVQFARLLDAAQKEDLASDTAVRLIDEALELWRGSPLEEFAHEDWARPEVTRFEELWATAVERRCEALIDLGRHGEALSQLARLVDTHPLRERPRALQMLALYRDGRQAEALRAYQQYRSFVIDEAGIDPSADLVELDRAIASEDQSIAKAAPSRQVRSYEIHESIGMGAFAEVYRGTQPALGRDVAIKAIRAELANRPEFIRAFEAEAAMVARLEHPHIVPLYDFWREPDRAYLVMRWITGGTLEASLDDGRWSMERTLTMVGQVGAALSVAHRAGVVHRDVKPANILLDADGYAYLSDFGIAMGVSEIMGPLAALSNGSPAYAAPEQLRREPVSPSSDIHSLGVTVYETLAGQLPFPDVQDRPTLLRHQLHDPLPSLRLLRPELPGGVDEVLARATAKDPRERYQTIDEFVLAFAGALATTPEPSSALVDSVRRVTEIDGEVLNPYKGLRAFDEGDAGDFYGRERLVDELVGRLREPGESSRMLALVGASGSGKSSVVRAGLIPALRAGRVDGADDWFITAMHPGTHPFEAMETALVRVAVNPPASLLSRLRDGSRGILRAIRRIVPDDSSRVLVVIDQFEELFTLCEDEGTRAQFLDALTTAVMEPSSPLRLVVTLRADFYDQPLRYGGFAELIKRHGVTLTPLAPDELEQAIVEPAHGVGVEFEPGLVSEIAAEASSEPGALPLMQYALTQLFDARVSGVMMIDVYRDQGGLVGALARKAEELYEHCSDDDQRAVRRLFGRLVTLGEGVDDTRRRVRRAELGEDAGTQRGVDIFGGARLLTFDREPTTRAPTVEVAHEALIREWPRLRGWLRADRDWLRTLRGLTEASASWEAGGRDAGELYRGARLSATLDWAPDHGEELTAVEQAFLAAGQALHEAELLGQRRINRRLRGLLAGVGIAFVAALIASVLAISQQNQAQTAADDAEAAALEAQAQREIAEESAVAAASTAHASDTARMISTVGFITDENQQAALLIAVEAYDRDPSVASTGALQTALIARTGFLGYVGDLDEPQDVDFAVDGSIVVSTRTTIEIFDPTGRTHLRTIDYSSLGIIATAPERPAVATTNGTDVVIFDAGTGERAVAFTPTSAPQGLWFAPTGELLVGDDTGAITIFSGDGTVVDELPGDPAEPGSPLGGQIKDLDFSHDGRTLITASADPDGFRIWDYPNRTELSRAELMTFGEGATDPGSEDPDPLSAGPNAVAFSPDDKHLAGSYFGGQVVIWDTATWQIEHFRSGGPAVLHDPGSNLFDIEIVATDPLRVVAVGDKRLVHWSLAPPPLLEVRDLSVPTRTFALSPGRSLALNRRNRILMTGSDLVEMWSIDDRGLIAEPLGGRSSVGDSVWVSSGGDFIIKHTGGVVVRYDVETGQETPITEDAFWGATMSPDDSVIVTSDSGPPFRTSSVRLWDVATLEPIGSPTEVPCCIQHRSFSPDGRYLAIGYGQHLAVPLLPVYETDGFIEIYEVTADGLVRTAEIAGFREMVAETGEYEHVSTTMFNHDGTRLIANSVGGVAAEWSVPDGVLLRSPAEVHATVAGKAIAVDWGGSFYAWRPDQSTLALVDQETLMPVGEPFLGAEGGHARAGFSLDDTLLFSGDEGGVRMWSVEKRAQIGRNFPNHVNEGTLFSGLGVNNVMLPADSPLGLSLITTTPNQLLAWKLEFDTWPEIACAAAGRNLTMAEWEKYGPNEPYHLTCDMWPTPRG